VSEEYRVVIVLCSPKKEKEVHDRLHQQDLKEVEQHRPKAAIAIGKSDTFNENEKDIDKAPDGAA
ncbi:hypothetical protein GcM1_151007, partial [Golovinomyces cichoracearum]